MSNALFDLAVFFPREERQACRTTTAEHLFREESGGGAVGGVRYMIDSSTGKVLAVPTL